MRVMRGEMVEPATEHQRDPLVRRPPLELVARIRQHRFTRLAKPSVRHRIDIAKMPPDLQRCQPGTIGDSVQADLLPTHLGSDRERCLHDPSLNRGCLGSDLRSHSSLQW